MLHTRFTELVGCTVPVQLAPMGGVNSAELVTAVTGAGAMAMTSAPGQPAAMVAPMLDALTGDAAGPVGFNMLLTFLDREVVAVAAARCGLVDFYHGPVDASLVRIVHEGGALAGWQVGSLEEARAAVDAGCDLLVVRGTEGGGRMYGTSALWPLLAEVLDAVAVPVLAAGGIASGRLLAAALAAGADGVRMGTRLLATQESAAHARYKDAVVAARPDDTVLTDAFATGWPDPEAKHARVLRSSVDAARAAPDDIVAKLTTPVGELPIDRFGPAPPTTAADGNIDAMAMYAGESVGGIDALEPAADVIRAIVAEAEARLRAATDQFT